MNASGLLKMAAKTLRTEAQAGTGGGRPPAALKKKVDNRDKTR